MLSKLLITLALLTAAALAFLYYIGVWNMLFGSPTLESEPPALPAISSPAILLYTKTNSFRHREGITAGVDLFESIAARRGWSTFHTENSATFNERDLARFSVVVFHNATGPTLDRSQQLAFERWLENGGAWLGVHAAGDGSHADWTWYMENLIGVRFTAHIMGPQFQQALVVMEQLGHPMTRNLPAEWQHEEEWYSWEASPRVGGFAIHATIDESTYSPVANFLGRTTDLAMGDHPVVWSNCVGNGRAVYSAMGHSAESYSVPEHAALLEGALEWLIDGRGRCNLSGERPPG